MSRLTPSSLERRYVAKWTIRILIGGCIGIALVLSWGVWIHG